MYGSGRQMFRSLENLLSQTRDSRGQRDKIAWLRRDREAKWNWLQWDTVARYTGSSGPDGAIGLVTVEQNVRWSHHRGIVKRNGRRNQSTVGLNWYYIKLKANTLKWKSGHWYSWVTEVTWPVHSGRRWVPDFSPTVSAPHSDIRRLQMGNEKEKLCWTSGGASAARKGN